MKRQRPFAWIALGFISGIILHNLWRPSVENIAVLATLTLGIAYLVRRWKVAFAIVMVFGFLVLGWLCDHSRWLFFDNDIYFQRNTIDFSQIPVRGTVDSEIRMSKIYSATRTSFELKLSEIKVGEQWQKCSGRVLVNLFQEISLHYGDDIVLTGKLHYPYDFSQGSKFSYKDYLARQGIRFVLSVKKDSPVEILRSHQGNLIVAQLLEWRTRGNKIFADHLDSSQASLMQAMLLGERLNIPQFLKDAFAQTGTTHILAISGLNVAIVVGVLFILLRMIPGPTAMPYFLTRFFITAYVLLTGASASVVRAGIMSVVLLTAFVIERESDGINSLCFAAFLILYMDSNNLFNIGFQLSFLSVLAILIFYPLFMGILKPVLKKKLLKFLAESMAVTFAATLGVGGLIAYYFGMVTPVSLLANILVVPLSSAEVVLGMGMLGCGVFCPPLIPVFGMCVDLILNVMVGIMFFFSRWPGAYFYIRNVTFWQIIGYYLIVIALGLFLTEFINRREKSPKSEERRGNSRRFIDNNSQL